MALLCARRYFIELQFSLDVFISTIFLQKYTFIKRFTNSPLYKYISPYSHNILNAISYPFSVHKASNTNEGLTKQIKLVRI